MPAQAGASDFEQLTRRHAVKLVPNANCTVEEATLAVGKEVGYANVMSASRMNGAIVMFLSSPEKVAEAVEKGAVIQDMYTSVLPLVSPSKRITISNAPPFIRNETLLKELSRFGHVVSPIKMISLGCKSPLLKHVVCHRRQVLMVLRDSDSELNVSFSFRVDGFTYMVFATSETMKCFGCGAEGHLIRACPERVEAAPRAMRSDAQTFNVPVSAESSGDGPAADPAVALPPDPTVSHTEEPTVVSVVPSTSNADLSTAAADTAAADTATDTAANVAATGATTADTGAAGAAAANVAEDASAAASTAAPCSSAGLMTVTDGQAAVTVGNSAASSSEEQQCVASGSASQSQAELRDGVEENSECDYLDEDMSDEDDLNLSQRKKNFDSYQGSEKQSKLPRSKKASLRSQTDSDVNAAEVYSAATIKKFLQDTKGMRSVRVVDFFPNLKRFVEIARPLTRTEQDVLTDQEVFRLKKLLIKVKSATE